MPRMPLIAFLFSRVCSVFGMQILACTYIFRLLENGIEAYGLSQLGLVATVASLGMALPTGALVDIISKRKAILTSHGLLLTVTIAATLRNSFDFYEILTVTGLVAISRNFRSISQFTIFGELLGKRKNISKWVNLSTLSWQIAAFLAPLLAGVLGSGQRSLILACGFISASMLTQLYIVKHLPKCELKDAPLPLKPEQKTIVAITQILRSAKDVIAHLQYNFKLRSSITLDFFIVLFAGASSLLPFLHSDKISTFELGLLKSALPGGIIFGTIVKLYKSSLDNWAEKLFIATFGYGLCHFLLGDSPSLLFSFILLFGAGVFDAISLAIRECILQIETPAHLKGRIYSLNNFLVNASDELSEWESGLAAHWIGVRPAIKLSGIIALLGASAFLWKSKSTKAVESFN